MEVPGYRAAYGLVEDVEHATAAAARRDPFAWVAGLGISVVVGPFLELEFNELSSPVWIVSAAYLAGAILSGGPRAERPAWKLDLCSVVVLVLSILVGQALLHTSGITTEIALLAVAGVAFHLGSGSRNRFAAASAVALAGVTLAPALLTAIFDRLPPEDRHPSWKWLAIAALVVAAHRSRWVLVAALAVGAITWHDSSFWRFGDLRGSQNREFVDSVMSLGIAVASVIAAVLLPVVTRRAVAALERSVSDEAATRLIVRIQRAPWRTAFVAFVVGAMFLARMGYGAPRAYILLTTAGVACLAMCCGSARSKPVGSLAPWVVSVALGLPLSIAMERDYRTYHLDVPALAVLVLSVPLVVGFLLSRARSVAFPWWGWIAAASIWVIEVWNFDSSLWYPAEKFGYEGLGTRDVAWSIILSLLVCSVATSSASPRIVLALSPIASFLVLDAFYSIRMYDRHAYVSDWSTILPALVAGPVAAFLALGARRVRSMTALPEDHPSFELTAARLAART